MSYLEIYNENIRDLLDPSTGYLELRDESKGKSIQVNIIMTMMNLVKK
jgi:kinesin family protein 18/19